jgi:general secretion pathway protein C
LIARIPPLPIWAFAALMTVSLGLSAGQVFWRLSGDENRAPAAARQPQPTDAPRFDLAPILAFLPFGSSVQQTPVQEVAGETSLGLALLGVTISVPASGSRAIISGGDGPARGYFVGEIITASASLSAIEPDHVVLNVGGRLETLSFTKSGAAATPTNGGPNLRNLIPSANPADAPSATSNDPDAVIARYRAAINLDAQGVMNRLGLEITDQGYRITSAASAGVRQAGFKAGDVVTTVNGQKVGDMAADQRYFDEVAASGRARVELLRDGQTIVMSFPLR